MLFRSVNDSGVLTTVDPATGKPFKVARIRGASDSYYASPVAADDKVVFISRSGKITVLKAGPDQQQIWASELDDEVVATPAIADGRIYVRSKSALYCFGETKTASEGRDQVHVRARSSREPVQLD